MCWSAMTAFLNVFVAKYRLWLSYLVLVQLLPRSLSLSGHRLPAPSQTRRQESLQLGNNPLLSLNLNLDALTRAKATDRAKELYNRIFALYEEGYYATAPDIVSFNTVLKGFHEDPAAAVAFWEQEMSGASTTSSNRKHVLIPNTRSYNTILLALARAGFHNECLGILRQMQDPETYIWPDRITYNTVLLSYAMSTDPKAPLYAESLMEEMIDISKQIDSKTGMAKGLAPDLVAYNTVITCWAQRGDADRAQAWLDRLRQSKSLILSSTGICLRPDVYSYTTVIQAWAKGGHFKEALALFEEMKAQPSTNSFPNKITYSALVQALAKKGRMTEAHALVDQMWASSSDAQPDVVTYSILLQGWAVAAKEEPESAVKAVDRILKEMEEKSRRYQDMVPNEYTWASALHVLAKARLGDAPTKAQEIVRRIPASTMNVFHYNAWLDVHAQSPRADKAVQCLLIWREMKMKGIVPDGTSYTSILQASANSFGNEELREKSLKIGLAAYQALDEQASRFYQSTDGEDVENSTELPISLTYSFLIRMLRKCGGSLSPADHRRWLRQALLSCGPRFGCMNSKVWDQFVEAADAVRAHKNNSVEDCLGLRDLLGSEKIEKGIPRFNELPSKWSRRAMKV